MMSEPLQPIDCQRMEFPLMSLPVAFRARTYRSRDSVPDLKALEAGYGRKSFDLLANYDPSSSLWKTSQTCLPVHLNDQDGGLAEFSETWPRSGMMRSGIAYRLPPLAPLTTEIDCGLLPTLTVVSAEHPGRQKLKKGQQVCLSMILSGLHGWKIGAQLSPMWVARFMGFPALWTVLDHSETLLSHKSQK